MGNVIAFVPASGGVGSSTLAAAVSVRAAAAGRHVVAVDLDPVAGCLDVVLGLEQEPGWRWPALAEVSGVVHGIGLADELPVSCGVPVLSGHHGADGWLVHADEARERCDAWVASLPDVVGGLAEAHDLTILDLPRDPDVLAAVALLVDAVVVVSGASAPQLAATSGVVRGVRALLVGLRDVGRPWEAEPLLPIEPWVVLRGHRLEPELQDLVMDELDVPLVATVGDDRRLRRGGGARGAAGCPRARRGRPGRGRGAAPSRRPVGRGVNGSRGSGGSVGSSVSRGSSGSSGSGGSRGSRGRPVGEPSTGASLTPAVWQRVRDGVGPDHAVVADVAAQERGALGERRVAETRSALASRVLGAGPLDAWLGEPGVTDVAVNGDGRIWVDRGHGMEWVGEQLRVDDARGLAVRLAGIAGRRLDESSPWVDGQLPSGARLHAMLPPLVDGGPHITIRVPAREPVSLAQLRDRAMVPPGWEPVLRALVERRLAFVVSGGTGAGKTTLLAALLGCTDPVERLLVVEDVRELTVDHPHVVRLEARPANVEGVGEVTLTTLVRQALRMRPDRIVVGEVRGAEVRELLAALNTGHEGGCGTVHANAPADVVARFEALGALAGLAPEAVRAQVVAALDAVVHVTRDRGARRVASVAALVRRDGAPCVVPALEWDGPGSPPRTGPGWPPLAARLGLPSALVESAAWEEAS